VNALPSFKAEEEEKNIIETESNMKRKIKEKY